MLYNIIHYLLKTMFCIPCMLVTLLAQNEYFQLGGYMKYLYSNSELNNIGRVNDHLIHSRLNGKIFFSSDITLTSEFRNRFYYGGSVENNPQFLESIKSNHDLGNIDVVWWQNKSSVGYSEVDRLNLDANIDKLQITIGRQRIAWGTAFVWNPTDIFNPLSILDFDYEEHPGVDALRAQYYFSAVSKIELAIKPGDRRENNIMAAKLLLNRWNYDFHFIGGIRAYRALLGFGWAGDILGAGFRGELFSSQTGDDVSTRSLLLNKKWSTSMTLSGDYTFPNTFYIHTEILYNNLGLTTDYSNSTLFIEALHLQSAARWSIYQEASYEIHPLVKGSLFIILNPMDKSFVFVPSLTWSVVENFDIMAIGFIFQGNPKTEYGEYGQSLLLRMKYSF
jgi:hypothetical protein